MSNDYHPQARSFPTAQADVSVDAGLRTFMLGVYNKMALGLVWSALVAYGVGAYAPLTQLVFGTPLFFVVQWGPIALLMFSNLFMRRPSPTGSAVLYWSVVTLIGAGLGIWVYLALTRTTGQSLGWGTLAPTFSTIAIAFLATAAAFGGLSLAGYTTKRNLSGLNSMLIMAVWGLVPIALLNFFFLKSGMFELIVQSVSVLLFAVLVATQTNTLREFYYSAREDVRSQAIMTNYGALNLYIAFIAIFQFLLQLLSSRR